MIRSIAFVLATSAARDPIPSLHDQIMAFEPDVVVDTIAWPPHEKPFRSWVYTSDDLERFGHRSLVDALRMTPGVVIGPSGGIYIHGTPLTDGSVMLDGVAVLGTPRAR